MKLWTGQMVIGASIRYMTNDLPINSQPKYRVLRPIGYFRLELNVGLESIFWGHR